MNSYTLLILKPSIHTRSYAVTAQTKSANTTAFAKGHMTWFSLIL